MTKNLGTKMAESLTIDLKKIHDECGKIFTDELIKDPEYGRSIACDIYDAMINDDGSDENCIGENFNQLVQIIKSGWFESYVVTEKVTVQFYSYTYLLWLNLFLERIAVILNDVDKEKSFEPIQTLYRELRGMNEIRLWANFIKHPKNFMFTHWPDFTFVGKKIDKGIETKLINTSFLKDHYSNQDQKQPIELTNNDNIIVQLPKLDLLTKRFCVDLKKFIRFICENKMIRDKLRSKSNM